MATVKITEQIKLTENNVADVEIFGSMVFSRGDGWFLEDVIWRNDFTEEENEVIAKHLLKNHVSNKLFTALDEELEERKLEGAI